MTSENELLMFMRETGKSLSAEEAAERFSLLPRNAHWILSALASDGLARVARGRGGVTTYHAVKPGTWIPWNGR